MSTDAGAPVSFPLAATLPAVYQGDPFVQAFCAALDQVLRPVVTTLDGMPAHLDPATAPENLLDWLASWVGLTLDPSWPADRRRALVAAAARLHSTRGTRSCLEEVVRLATGEEPDVQESGGCGWSHDPSAPLPGSPAPRLVVTVRASGGPDAGAPTALTGLLALFVPVHVPWELRVR